MGTLTQRVLLLRTTRSMISREARRRDPTAPSWSTGLRRWCIMLVLKMVSQIHKERKPPPFWTFRSTPSSCSRMIQIETPSTLEVSTACLQGLWLRLGMNTAVSPLNPLNLLRPTPGHRAWIAIKLLRRKRKDNFHPRVWVRECLQSQEHSLSLCLWPSLRPSHNHKPLCHSPDLVSPTWIHLSPSRPPKLSTSLCFQPSLSPRCFKSHEWWWAEQRPHADLPVPWAAPTPPLSVPAVSLMSFLYAGRTPVAQFSSPLPVPVTPHHPPALRLWWMNRWRLCMQTASTAMRTDATSPSSLDQAETSTQAPSLPSMNSLRSLMAKTAATTTGAGRGAGTGSIQRTANAPAVLIVPSACELAPATWTSSAAVQAHQWSISWGLHSSGCRRQRAVRNPGSCL